jgi:ADP-ribose pyrophosphatase YjhB (NUDIX family)
MNKSRLNDLKRCTTKIVTKASQPGGSLEKGEFTLGLARRLITEEMGLEPGELDVKEWKGVVKELVKKALVRHP